MPTAKELLDAGKLAGAIEAATAEVKANPTDVPRRTTLFELLCFAGEWDRAEKQIDVIGQQSVQAAMAVQVYRANIQAERSRERLFDAGVAPHFLTEPTPYVDTQLEALASYKGGDIAGARALLDKAEEARPAISGTWNGQKFLDIRDYNDLTAPILELVVKDKYVWLPLDQVRKVAIEPPKKLRDLLWIPARIEAKDGTVGEVFLFALYPGSHRHAEEAVRLGRKTEWKDAGGDLYVGAGQRLFLVDEDDRPILEARTLEFELDKATGPARQ
jgi:type VI secretion system protein ImpE